MSDRKNPLPTQLRPLDQTIRSVSNGTALRAIGATPVPLISVRLNGSNQDKVLRIIRGVGYCDSNADSMVTLVRGGALTGETFNTPAGSFSEFDIVATAITGGTTIATDFIKSSVSSPSRVSFEEIFKHVSVNLLTTEILSVVIQTFSGSGNFAGSIGFKELNDVDD